MKNYIETPTLELDKCGYKYSFNGNSDWELCAFVIQDHFELPKKATHIQFRAYKEDGRDEEGHDRVKVCFCVNGDDSVTLIDNENEYILMDTRESIRKLRGRRKTWYVELYYWE